MEKRHITYVIESSYWGGSEEYLYSLIHAALGDGWRVSLAVITNSLDVLWNEKLNELQNCGVQIEKLQKRSGRLGIGIFTSIHYYRQALFHLRERGVIHFVLSYPDLLVIPLLHCSIYRSYFGATFQLAASTPLSRKRRLLWKFIALRARFLVSVSYDDRTRLSQYAGVPLKKTRVIYNSGKLNFYDTQIHMQVGVSRQSIACRDSIVFAYIGRLEKRKGLTLLLQATHVVWKSTSRRIELLIIGDGPEANNLVALANELEMREQVVFLGYVSDTKTVLRRADCFVLPSFNEGLPLSIVEAMLTRLPVIASRVGGIPEVVQEKVTGLLFTPGDATGLASAMQFMCEHPEERIGMGRRGQEIAVRRFSPQSMWESTQRLYEIER